MKNKELLAELKAYSDSLRQKVEAKFEGWDDSLSAISERRKKVLDPVSGYDFLCRITFRIMCVHLRVHSCITIF